MPAPALIGNGTGQRRAYRQAGDAHAGGQQRQHQLGQSQAERRNGAAHYPHGQASRAQHQVVQRPANRLPTAASSSPSIYSPNVKTSTDMILFTDTEKAALCGTAFIFTN